LREEGARNGREGFYRAITIAGDPAGMRDSSFTAGT